MNILIACEYSGTVRDAFTKQGHYAVSCDLEPSDTPGNHYQGDVFNIIGHGWDLMIAHPPCTHLAVSGAKWFKEKIADGRQQAALSFVQNLMGCGIPRICIENPISIISSKIKKPTQIIQPYMFGHTETKATCLWLTNLPDLIPTHDLKTETMKLPENERMRLHYLPPSPMRAKLRSKTFQGIADAMASQWGGL